MFILSIENSPGSIEGSDSTQMTPKLENKAFIGKNINPCNLNAIRNLITPHLRLAKEVRM
jgi:hypothetical protein